MKKLPLFARFLEPIVATLRASGNVAPAREVAMEVIKRCAISSTELEAFTAAGLPRVKNQIHWARFYLVRAGYLDASTHGVWRLTERGQSANLDMDAVHSILRFVRSLPPVQSERVTHRRSSAAVREGELQDKAA